MQRDNLVLLHSISKLNNQKFCENLKIWKQKLFFPFKGVKQKLKLWQKLIHSVCFGIP